MYIVRYSKGEFKDETIFVTSKKSTATKYVTRFNKILKKWSKEFEQYEDSSYGMPWILKEFVDTKFNRWCTIREINRCYWEEVELR